MDEREIGCIVQQNTNSTKVSNEEVRQQAKFESQILKKTVKRSEGVAAPFSH